MIFTDKQVFDIFEKVEQHYILKPYPNGIAGMQDVDSRVFAFRAINDFALLRHIQSYTIPESADENFDPLLGCVNTFLINIYPFKVIEASARYFRLIDKAVRIVQLPDDDEQTLSDGGLCMTLTDNKIVQDQLEAVKRSFRRLLKPGEIVLWDMIEGHFNAEATAAILYPDSKFCQKVDDAIRYRAGILRFRFACYLATKDFYTARVILKILNSYSAQLKKFFGCKRLEELPDTAKLLDAARGQMCPVDVPQAPGVWKPFSKTDFNGHTHDHFVVYTAPSGKLYDHVTKQVR